MLLSQGHRRELIKFRISGNTAHLFPFQIYFRYLILMCCISIAYLGSSKQYGSAHLLLHIASCIVLLWNTPYYPLQADGSLCCTSHLAYTQLRQIGQFPKVAREHLKPGCDTITTSVAHRTSAFAVPRQSKIRLLSFEAFFHFQ